MKLTILKKDIKNLYIKVKNDEVFVSVPKKMSKTSVDKFINSKMDWINKKLDIKRIVIKSKITNDNYLKAMIKFSTILEKYLKFYNESDVRMNIKEQKTRWGSCNKFRRVINLNIALYELEDSVLEYVIAHEVAHLKYANHKSEFYEHLELSYPNYKEAINKLRKYTLER